jgi:hypothetical protein
MIMHPGGAFSAWDSISAFLRWLSSLTERFESGCGRATITFEPRSKVLCIGAYTLRGCGQLSSICIPSSVEELCGNCCCQCISLCTVACTFEAASRLSYIEGHAFHGCSALSSICIQPLLAELDPFAFVGTNLWDITVGSGNYFFKVIEHFLMDIQCESLGLNILTSSHATNSSAK